MTLRMRRPYYVPRTCRDLRAGLLRMGIKRINGQPLSRVRKQQLLAVYIRVRDERWHGPMPEDVQ